MSTELPYPQPYTHLENVDLAPEEIASLGIKTVTGLMTANVQRTQQEIRKTITTGCSSLDLLLDDTGALSNSPQILSLRNVLLNCVNEAATVESHLPQVSRTLEPKKGVSNTSSPLHEQPKSKRKRKTKLEMIELRAQGLAIPKRRKKDPSDTLESKLSSISSDIQPERIPDISRPPAAALLANLHDDVDEATRIPVRSDSESDTSERSPETTQTTASQQEVKDKKRRAKQERKMLAKQQLSSPQAAQVSDKQEKLRSISKDKLKRAIARKQAAQQAHNAGHSEAISPTFPGHSAESLVSRPSTNAPLLSQSSPTPVHGTAR